MDLDITAEVRARFWSRVDMTGECWLWTGGRSSGGYGQFKVQGVTWIASRFAYILTHGPIPAGLVICHRCDNPPCCRPDHLFLGTHADNSKDRQSKGRTRTRHGVDVPLAKLTEESVRTIRDRYARGDGSYRFLGRAYGVSDMCIRKIISGKTWAHVDGPPISAPTHDQVMTIDDITALHRLADAAHEREVTAQAGDDDMAFIEAVTDYDRARFARNDATSGLAARISRWMSMPTEATWLALVEAWRAIDMEVP